MSRLRPVLREAFGDPWALALRMTLLIAVLDSSIYSFVRGPVLLVAGVGLVVPGAWRWRGVWWALVAAVAWPLFWNWPFPDNHDYLRALWALAVALSVGARSPSATLERSARLMLGGVFLLATLWKGVLSPDYLSGSFFRVTLLSDGRFQSLAVLLGGIHWETIDAFDRALEAFLAGHGGAWSFVVPASLGRLADFLTGFTLLLEGGLALAFLWPREGRVRGARNPLLLLFAFTTYAVASVSGFGWLLMAMGAAQTRPSERLARFGYVAGIFVIEAYSLLPWAQWLLDALGRG